MKVVILHYAAPPIVGGVESTIYHQARLLVQAGHQVSVVAGRGRKFHPQVTFHSIPEVDSRHPKVQEVGRFLARGQVPTSFFELRDGLLERLHFLLADADVSIVHNAITLHKNLALTAALRIFADEASLPLVAWCHDFAWQDSLYISELHGGYPWDLLRTAWPGVCYVAVSAPRRAQLAQLLGLPETSIYIVTPGVEPEEFLKLEPATRRLVEELRLLDADPLMLLPARITRRKNIEFAIQVTAVLVPFFPKTTLVVTGPPGAHNPTNLAYLESLKELRQALNIGSHICFLYEHGREGRRLHVTDAVLADLFRLADILLFPSRREGFGIPVLEAGLARLPIFAARIPPIQETVGELGYLFPPDGDPQAVAQAIATYLRVDSRYRFRRRVLAGYTWRAILEQHLLPLLEEVAKRER